MSDTDMPPGLDAALATEPLWLQAWVMLLVITHVTALLFVVRRRPEGGLAIRPEPVAIVLSFLAAGVAMSWLYQQVGYVRLLGLPHLVFWGPVWAWVLHRRHDLGARTPFAIYVRAYLLVAGTSLVIDLVDVIRYLAGDGQLLHRGG